MFGILNAQGWFCPGSRAARAWLGTSGQSTACCPAAVTEQLVSFIGRVGFPPRTADSLAEWARLSVLPAQYIRTISAFASSKQGSLIANSWLTGGELRLQKENRDGKCLMLSGTKYLTECFSLKTTEHVKKHQSLFYWQLIQCPPTPQGKACF